MQTRLLGRCSSSNWRVSLRSVTSLVQSCYKQKAFWHLNQNSSCTRTLWTGLKDTGKIPLQTAHPWRVRGSWATEIHEGSRCVGRSCSWVRVAEQVETSHLFAARVTGICCQGLTFQIWCHFVVSAGLYSKQETVSEGFSLDLENHWILNWRIFSDKTKGGIFLFGRPPKRLPKTKEFILFCRDWTFSWHAKGRLFFLTQEHFCPPYVYDGQETW